MDPQKPKEDRLMTNDEAVLMLKRMMNLVSTKADGELELQSLYTMIEGLMNQKIADEIYQSVQKLSVENLQILLDVIQVISNTKANRSEKKSKKKKPSSSSDEETSGHH